VTDFASIPPVFWQVLRPDGEYAYAAVIHDYLYWVQDRSREEADLVFLHVMEDFRIPAIERMAIYGAVKKFGERAWNNNKTARENGEKRILKRLPESPTVSWAEWRIDPGVFD
jgi:hypothetical protein